MPARASTRTARPSSSTTTTLSRKSTADTTTTSAITNGDVQEPPPSKLRVQITRIFADAQHTTASHRKLVNNLRRIQEGCCYESPTSDGTEEEHFNEEIDRCILRLMGVKKSESVGDRIVRFLGLFLKHAGEKDHALNGDTSTDEDLLSDTPTSRLTSRILSTLLPLLTSKEKQVRYRSTQLLSHIINSVDSIDDDLFQSLRLGLLKRLRDKESMVRVQAVLGLGRLAGNEAEDDPNEDESDLDNNDYDSKGGLLERLLKVLSNDPSADVRRSLLLNLPLTPMTLPSLLERARDQDASTRRALYSRLLPALGDFRHLSLSMREKLLRWGLRDRDENVRKAAGRLFREYWIEDCAGTHAAPIITTEENTGNKDKATTKETTPPNFDALLELLERIDIVNAGAEDGVGLEAMLLFWEGRPDYRDAVTFDTSFWEHLSAEAAFMVRSFNHFCRRYDHQKQQGGNGNGNGGGRYEILLEEKMPEVTRFAFYMERYILRLVDVRKKENEKTQKGDESSMMDIDNDNNDEHDTVELEFIVEQLLHIAQLLDYSDEVGRRKMFALMRETLATPELPDEATKLVVELLKMLCGADSSEREFCGVVLEAVAEVHDSLVPEDGENNDKNQGPGQEEEDDSFHSARSEISGESNGVASSYASGGKKGGFSNTKRQRKTSEETVKAGGGADQDEDDEERKAIRQIIVNMKCLHIAQCMLENVEGALQDNGHLVSMLNNLVVPAVRSHEAPLRERGLLCLGLCCLLDKTLAQENLTLFLHCFNKGHSALQIYALHILSDILITHGSSILDSQGGGDHQQQQPGPNHKAIYKVFTKALKQPFHTNTTTGSPSSDYGSDLTKQREVQSASCTALCKLMLRGIFTDEDLLKALVIAYFDPDTAGNLTLRQALSYFLPVYCHSRIENLQRMVVVAVPVLRHLMLIQENRDEDEDDEDVGIERGGKETMVGLAVVAGHLVEWTDVRRLVGGDGKEETSVMMMGGHVALARNVLERLCSGGCQREEKKILASMLGKLFVPTTLPSHLPNHNNSQNNNNSEEEGADSELIEKIHTLATRVVEEKNLLPDAVSRNAASKLLTAIEKLLDAFEQRDRERRKNSVEDKNKQQREKKKKEDGEEDEGTSAGNDTLIDQTEHDQEEELKNGRKRRSSVKMETEIAADELQAAAAAGDDTITTTAHLTSILEDEDDTVLSTSTIKKSSSRRRNMRESESLLDDLLADDDDEGEELEAEEQDESVSESVANTQSQLSQLDDEEEEEL
ncbi:MAG: hypothetical protein M1823_001215 [Watsoniomyces obsoletus]|nr:MAG: hypothetical protein M1823_001215 [Watsoniomyces obsoletus]